MYQPYRFREPHWGYQYEKHLRELLRIDFPELLPVYVISILAAGKKFWRDGTKAYTGPFLDLYLREFLASSGRWRGRGVCTVVQSLDGKPDEILDMLLHEAAHYFEFAEVLLLSPIEKFPQEYQDRLKGNQKKSANEFGTRQPVYPWAGHDSNFIRSALHVAHRSRLAGFLTTIETMEVTGSFYGLSSPQQYAEALQSEPQLFSTARIWDIFKKSSPPQEFTDLFESDVADYESRNVSQPPAKQGTQKSTSMKVRSRQSTAIKSVRPPIRRLLANGEYSLKVNSSYGFQLIASGCYFSGVFVKEASRLVKRLSRLPEFKRIVEHRTDSSNEANLLYVDQRIMRYEPGIKRTDRIDFEAIMEMVFEAVHEKSVDVIFFGRPMSTRVQSIGNCVS